MATLNGLPCVELFRVGFFVLRGSPTDGCGIKKDLRPHQCGYPRSLRIPLIPAYQHTYGCKPGLKNFVTKITRCEIEFFVVRRIVGDMHFPVFSKIGSVSIQNGGGVVIKTFRSLLEKRSYDHHPKLFG